MENGTQEPQSEEAQEYDCDPEEWAGEFDPLSDPQERRVLFAALDSFRYVWISHFILGEDVECTLSLGQYHNLSKEVILHLCTSARSEVLSQLFGSEPEHLISFTREYRI